MPDCIACITEIKEGFVCREVIVLIAYSETVTQKLQKYRIEDSDSVCMDIVNTNQANSGIP